MPIIELIIVIGMLLYTVSLLIILVSALIGNDYLSDDILRLLVIIAIIGSMLAIFPTMAIKAL